MKIKLIRQIPLRYFKEMMKVFALWSCYGKLALFTERKACKMNTHTIGIWVLLPAFKGVLTLP